MSDSALRAPCLPTRAVATLGARSRTAQIPDENYCALLSLAELERLLADVRPSRPAMNAFEMIARCAIHQQEP